MMYALIPLMLSLIAGIKKLSIKVCALLTALICLEYAIAYHSRYPTIRYNNEYFEYYPAITIGLLVAGLVWCLISLKREPIHQINFPQSFRIMWTRYILKPSTPKALIFVSVFALFSTGIILPMITPIIFDSSVYKINHQEIDLLKWRSVVGTRDGQSFINMDVATSDNAHSMWINTGQSLAFNGIPLSQNSHFIAKVRIYGDWSKDQLFPPPRFIVLAKSRDDTVSGSFELTKNQDPEIGWNKIDIDLTKLSGKKIDLVISSVGTNDGIWTLWQEPRITTAL
jgi:hypothetical protein